MAPYHSLELAECCKTATSPASLNRAPSILSLQSESCAYHDARIISRRSFNNLLCIRTRTSCSDDIAIGGTGSLFLNLIRGGAAELHCGSRNLVLEGNRV